jgi:hypothetical protein
MVSSTSAALKTQQQPAQTNAMAASAKQIVEATMPPTGKTTKISP